MDVYEFTHEGTLFKVEPGRVDYERRVTEAIGGGVDLAVQGSSLAALCAEVLRLAGELRGVRLHDEALAADVRALNAQVAEQARTIDRLKADSRDWNAQVATLGAENYALAQKAKRRKAKIRKLREELRVIGHQLEAARVLSAQAEREAVLAYLEREKIYGYLPVAEAVRRIREGAHLTAPASPPPQEPSPSGESAPE